VLFKRTADPNVHVVGKPRTIFFRWITLNKTEILIVGKLANEKIGADIISIAGSPSAGFRLAIKSYVSTVIMVAG